MTNSRLRETPADVDAATANSHALAEEYSADQTPAILDRLLDLELPVCIALGHAEIALKDVLKMKPGSVVQLDKEAGEEVDLLVHGTLVARGEIVLVDDNYGIRITHIINRTPQSMLSDVQRERGRDSR
jgi:flagellar motor switch protein FliN